MKATFKNLGKHLLWGILIILGGLFLYMVGAQILGYLPYSDRPGPGWYKGEILVDWDGLKFVLDFILFLGIYIIGSLILVYGLFRIFRLFGYNRIIYSILGGLIIGFLCLYWTLGIGWYIAIDGSTVTAGGILGLIYGATIFPKLLRPKKEQTLGTTTYKNNA